MSPIFGFFIFFAIIVLTSVLFGGWVLVSIVRLIVRVLSGGPARPALHQPALPAGMVNCPNERCHAANPTEARFCHRCGRLMRQEQHAMAQRAAML